MSTLNGSVSTSALVNPIVSEFFLTFNLIVWAELIGCFGIVGNVVNILNFRKQGLHDSVNVTLTMLAVSDIGSLLFKLPMNIFVSPFWGYVGLPFTSIATLLFYFPNGYFIRVSGYITAFAAFERCLCVVLPLKVKTIITRRVTIVVNCCICVVLLLYLFPVYYVSYLGLKYNPKTNRSVINLLRRGNADTVYGVSFFINDLVLPYVSFLTLILCTTFLITSLKSKAKWRHSVTVANVSQSNGKATFMSSKEKKTTAMLTTVSVIFVACLTPGCVLLIAMGVIPDLKVGGAYIDMTLLVLSFTFLLETINCSVNTIVYYKMSSKYREIIHAWFSFFRKRS